MTDFYGDEYFMNEAIKEAEKAFRKDEVPIGAVIVAKNKIIARTHNLMETLKDTTAHAEIQAITAATEYIGGKYLNHTTIYVTLEPCVMCCGAIFWSQISRLVFGAHDTKNGFLKYQKVLQENKLSLTNNKLIIASGILESECSEMLKTFFRIKRK